MTNETGSAPEGIPAAIEPKPAGPGFVATLLDLYFAPRQAFEAIVKNPRFWVPLVLVVLLGLAFTAVWLQKVDVGEFMKAQREETGRWDQTPAEQREVILEGQGKFFPVMAWVGALVGGPVTLLVVSAVLLFVFRLFYSSEVDFRRALSVVAWSFLAVSLISTPLMLLVLYLKGDWNINPQEVLQANPTLFLDKSTASHPLWAFASSLDLFSFWLVGLLAAGFAAATRKSWGSVVWGVVLPWALWVLGKVGLAFIR